MQCKALRDSAREIQSFDVAYFMASVDTLEENTAFAEEHQAGFPILSDPEKRMTKDYGVLMAAGFARRWTYYIDVDGTILKIDKETKPATAGRDLTRTMEELGFQGYRISHIEKGPSGSFFLTNTYTPCDIVWK